MKTEYRCHHQSCSKTALSSARPYCVKHFDELTERCYGRLNEIQKISKDYYIGKTTFPERTALEHFKKSNRPYLDILHWCSSRFEALHLEELLIEAMPDSGRKAKNKLSANENSINESFHCIYISYAPKLKSSPVELFYGIKSLHIANRIWPTRKLNKVVTLRAICTRDEAEYELNAIKPFCETLATR